MDGGPGLKAGLHMAGIEMFGTLRHVWSNIQKLTYVVMFQLGVKPQLGNSLMLCSVH